MVEYIVAGLRTNINNQVYERGDNVELSDTEALPLLSLGIIIPVVDTKLPTESDELFAELQKKVVDLEKIIEKQKGMIANFAAELEAKNLKIAEFEATQGKRRR